MDEPPTEPVDVARLYVEHGEAVAERDHLRNAVGHVALLINLGKAVAAMRDAEARPSNAANIADYQAAKALAYRLISQWEAERRNDIGKDARHVR